MISKDLFKSHPIPVQEAFRINQRHLFHFCIICIFKGFKLNKVANNTDLHCNNLSSVILNAPPPPTQAHRVDTKVQLFTLHACTVSGTCKCVTHPPEKDGANYHFPLDPIPPGVPCHTYMYTDIRRATNLFSCGYSYHF